MGSVLRPTEIGTDLTAKPIWDDTSVIREHSCHQMTGISQTLCPLLWKSPPGRGKKAWAFGVALWHRSGLCGQ